MLNWLQPKTQLEMNTASASRCERLGGNGDRALSEPVLMWEIHIYKMVQFQTDQRNDWCAKKEKNRKIVRCPYLQATSAWPIQYSRKKATAKSKKIDYERDAEIGIKQQRRWRRWQQMKRTQINRTQKKNMREKVGEKGSAWKKKLVRNTTYLRCDELNKIHTRCTIQVGWMEWFCILPLFRWFFQPPRLCANEVCRSTGTALLRSVWWFFHRALFLFRVQSVRPDSIWLRYAEIKYSANTSNNSSSTISEWVSEWRNGKNEIKKG